MSETELTQLARRYLALRAEKFRRQGELKALEEDLDSIEQRISENLQAQKMTKFDYDGNLLYKQVNAYPKASWQRSSVV